MPLCNQLSAFSSEIIQTFLHFGWVLHIQILLNNTDKEFIHQTWHCGLFSRLHSKSNITAWLWLIETCTSSPFTHLSRWEGFTFIATIKHSNAIPFTKGHESLEKKLKSFSDSGKKMHFSPAVIQAPSLSTYEMWCGTMRCRLWGSSVQTGPCAATSGFVQKFYLQDWEAEPLEGIRRRGDERQMQPTLKWKRGPKEKASTCGLEGPDGGGDPNVHPCAFYPSVKPRGASGHILP